MKSVAEKYKKTKVNVRDMKVTYKKEVGVSNSVIQGTSADVLLVAR